ncbi:hypothetical protein MSG28_009787 [Choristoneura fumiferana]|uniref:Uncharacterized protein n=1 Tax=Choristoneura fumiferana TaxID=7141 RepID=A0ACC0JCK3_CHOFU|nr:hypothetical protein MSG28_009787 [Choristoneura fumiferana]
MLGPEGKVEVVYAWEPSGEHWTVDADRGGVALPAANCEGPELAVGRNGVQWQYPHIPVSTTLKAALVLPTRLLVLAHCRSLNVGIWGDFGNNKEQRKIASGPQLENNFGETRERQENRNGTSEMILQRKTRDSLASEVYDGLRCLSCYANNGTSSLYDSCYNGLMAPLIATPGVPTLLMRKS